MKEIFCYSLLDSVETWPVSFLVVGLLFRLSHEPPSQNVDLIEASVNRLQLDPTSPPVMQTPKGLPCYWSLVPL
jgi:hypothetical protein